MNTLTKEWQPNIPVEKRKFISGGQPNGPMIFRLLIQKAIIDTRQTAGKFWYNLFPLDTYMNYVNTTIEEFNRYIKLNREGIKTQVEQFEKIMSNLFKGYKVVKDK